MRSKITDKYQITIPKKIREKLKLSRNDIIEWKLERGLVIVEPINKPFLKFKGSIKIGKGNIEIDIKKARKRIAELTG